MSKQNYDNPCFQDQFKKFMRRKHLTLREWLFVLYYYRSAGKGTEDKVAAYMRAFETNNPKYAASRASELLRTERARDLMEKMMKDAMKRQGVDADYFLKEGKKAIEESQGEKKIHGLGFLANFTGLGEANKRQLPQGGLRGFIGAKEIQVIDAEEEPERIEEHSEVKVHHGDIIDESVSPELGEEQDSE